MSTNRQTKQTSETRVLAMNIHPEGQQPAFALLPNTLPSMGMPSIGLTWGPMFPLLQQGGTNLAILQVAYAGAVKAVRERRPFRVTFSVN